MGISITDVTTAIQLASAVLPGVEALVVGLKTIWLGNNPGKTEADWIASLVSDSSQLTTEADAQLVKDGYTQDANGSWIPPAV